jgi:hypothetical protein
VAHLFATCWFGLLIVFTTCLIMLLDSRAKHHDMRLVLEAVQHQTRAHDAKIGQLGQSLLRLASGHPPIVGRGLQRLHIAKPAVEVVEPSSGVVVDIEFTSDPPSVDSTAARWLAHVVHRVPAGRDSDTPAPMAQRAPLLPPPSSSPGGPSRR